MKKIKHDNQDETDTVNTCKQYIYILCISIFIQPMICMSWSSLTAVIFWGTFPWFDVWGGLSRPRFCRSPGGRGINGNPNRPKNFFFGHRNLLKNEKCWSKILRKVMLIYLIYLKKCWSDVELRIGWFIGGSSWTMLNYVELAKTWPLGFPIEGRVPRSAAVSTNCFALCLRSLASRYIETYSDRLNKVLDDCLMFGFLLVLDLSFHHPSQ